MRVNDPCGFTSSIGAANPEVEYRVYARMPDGNTGITPWYTRAVVEELQADIAERGHVVLMVEFKRN